MAKRPSLAASMKAVAREPAEDSPTPPVPMPEPDPGSTDGSASLPVATSGPQTHPSPTGEHPSAGTGYRAKTREGMKRLTVVVPPEDHRRIKRLSVDLDRSIEDIMREALADLLQRHNA